MTNHTHESHVFRTIFKIMFFSSCKYINTCSAFYNLVSEDWSCERMRKQGDRCIPSKKDERGMLTLQLFLKKGEKEDD